MRKLPWCFSLLLAAVVAATAAQDGDWTAYGRDAGGERFSPLDQIRASNVGSLAVAWTYRTGDAFTPADGRPTAFEATPLVVDGILFLSTPLGKVIALDPVSGQPRWVYDAVVPRDKGYGDFASRGVSFWRRGNERRIIVATVDARLIALEAGTGRLVHGFGEGGIVDLRRGLRVPPTGFADYEVTSPPAIVNNTIVVGSGIADGTSKPHPSGEVRGFDVVSGALKWSWDPVPQDPAAIGGNSWAKGSSAHLGGANAWSVIVADPARNLVFVPTSSPSNDYYGGERPGDNLFSDSVVALRADTGKRVWHFQTVHHDLWDYDVASPPLLFDWRKDGRTVPAVAIASKTGHLFILDRTTGTPLIPVEERPVPASDVPGETAAPTQPFPVAPHALAPARLTADQAWGATDADRQWCRDTIRALRSEGPFTPPSLTGTLVVPGNVGGMAWGGLAHDRINDLLIMPVNNLAAEVRLVARDRVDAERQAGRLSGEFEYHPQLATRYGMVRRFLLAPGSHLPCTPPPWGTLAAIKPSTGEVAWQVPLGQLPSTRNQPGLEKSGSIALGGPIATAGGIVFTAGTLEAAIYAFEAKTGALLWTGTLPTSARSTPMTYLGRDGRQYVVVAAGGHGTPLGPPIGDSLVAFALPRPAAR
ncbi:MAG: pyrroloquinoline quinone-dependent dehydrogenase [Vicinamibacterales bacterium]